VLEKSGAPQKLKISLATLNGRLKLYALVVITAEFESGGFLTTHVTTYNVAHNFYTSNVDKVRATLEAVVLFGVLVQAFLEGRQLLALRREYFYNAYNYLDALSILLFLVTGLLWITILVRRGNTLSLSHVEEVVTDTADLSQFIDDITWLGRCMSVYVILSSLNVGTVVFRALQYTELSAEFSILTRTVRRSSKQLAHFVVLFGIVFLAYSFAAYLTFGTQIHEFSSYGLAIQACFNIMLGVYDYEALLEVSEYATVLFFWSFTVFVVFIMLQLFIAIVIDAYLCIKAEQQVGHTKRFEKWLMRDVSLRSVTTPTAPVSNAAASVSTTTPRTPRHSQDKPRTEDEAIAAIGADFARPEGLFAGDYGRAVVLMQLQQKVEVIGTRVDWRFRRLRHCVDEVASSIESLAAQVKSKDPKPRRSSLKGAKRDKEIMLAPPQLVIPEPQAVVSFAQPT